jgi:hypothetical protein
MPRSASYCASSASSPCSAAPILGPVGSREPAGSRQPPRGESVGQPRQEIRPHGPEEARLRRQGAHDACRANRARDAAWHERCRAGRQRKTLSYRLTLVGSPKPPPKQPHDDKYYGTPGPQTHPKEQPNRKHGSADEHAAARVRGDTATQESTTGSTAEEESQHNRELGDTTALPVLDHGQFVLRPSMAGLGHSCVRRTLELSCEAPIVPGFVSFNSLLGGVVHLLERECSPNLGTPREEHSRLKEGLVAEERQRNDAVWSGQHPHAGLHAGRRVHDAEGDVHTIVNIS